MDNKTYEKMDSLFENHLLTLKPNFWKQVEHFYHDLELKIWMKNILLPTDVGEE